MMRMSIAGFNARTTPAYALPAAPHRPVPRNTDPPALAAETRTHGVRSVGKELGEVKDPTWKLQQLLDGKKCRR